ncbi:protein FAR1-RELATED SEQUENCE 5-like [Rhizophagus irregularis DAOM 181602=DAOM 197198]|nr:protein FAR1-RELATED SEQUENCE 5-like [Rhizophagus irregularis DAOM 181602=DAOM 197198]
MEEEASKDTQTSEFTYDDCNNIGNEMILSNENHHTLLYSERKFESWEACENFIIIRTYESNSTRDTVTKKIGCPFVVNASCPKLKTPEEYVIINKIVEQYNHPLDVSIVEFEDSRKFTDSMIEDIKFMTVSSKLSNWLDSQKEIDSRWLIFRGLDEDNTLTHLSWMTPYQVENWVKYSDCVINDVTHKTNRYGMALSLIVGFNNDRKNLILAQGLLIDESLDSHIWMFNNIVEATGIRPVVIITDSDPAIAYVNIMVSYTSYIKFYFYN